MEEVTVKRILAEVTECKENYSLGFRRYIYLPSKVRDLMFKAHYLLNGGADSMAAIKTFLGGLSEQEYKLWLKQQ